MRADGWIGGLDEGEVGRGFAGGFEAGWGATEDVRVTLAFEGFGASSEGGLEGNSPGTVTVDPVLGVQRQRITRLERYVAASQMLGATILASFDGDALAAACNRRCDVVVEEEGKSRVQVPLSLAGLR